MWRLPRHHNTREGHSGICRNNFTVIIPSSDSSPTSKSMEISSQPDRLSGKQPRAMAQRWSYRLIRWRERQLGKSSRLYKDKLALNKVTPWWAVAIHWNYDRITKKNCFQLSSSSFSAVTEVACWRVVMQSCMIKCCHRAELAALVIRLNAPQKSRSNQQWAWVM